MKSAYKVSQDQSGITIATAEMPHMSSVALGIWVGVGGRYEPAPLCGVSHFIEHMLFKGTKRRNARQISQDVEGVGGYLNAFTIPASGKQVGAWPFLACQSPIERRVLKPGNPSAPPTS